jgi:hypothetical protein
MVDTDNERDLNYLEELLQSSRSYKKVKIPELYRYDQIWLHARDDNTMYFKIDDDTVLGLSSEISLC